MNKTASSPGIMSTKSDPESQTSVLGKIPENSTAQRRQSYPLEEPLGTPTAFSDSSDSDSLLSDIDTGMYGNEDWPFYYPTEMVAQAY